MIVDDLTQQMIDRLKKCQEEDFKAGKSAGIEAGKMWAEHEATLRDLRCVCGEGGMDTDTFFTLLDNYWDTLGILSLFEDYDGPTIRDAYADGFRDGAMQAWNKVCDHFTE